MSQPTVYPQTCQLHAAGKLELNKSAKEGSVDYAVKISLNKLASQADAEALGPVGEFRAGCHAHPADAKDGPKLSSLTW